MKKASVLSKCKNEDSVGEGRPAIIAQGGRGCAEMGEGLHNETEETARIRQEIGVPPPPSPPPIEPPRQLITIVRNRNNMPKKFSQLDGTSHQGVDNDDNEEPDGLEERETDNQEPEETNETDASVGESTQCGNVQLQENPTTLRRKTTRFTVFVAHKVNGIWVHE